MSLRAPLKAAKPFNFYLKQLLQLSVDEKEARRIERSKMSADAALDYICLHADCDRKRLEELDAKMVKLPQSAEFSYAFHFVDEIKRRALDHDGDRVPPTTGWVHHDLLPRLALSCQFLRCNVMELVGVAWRRAAREQPEVFALGYNSQAEHEAHLASFAMKREKLLQEAANALDFEQDLQIDWYLGGSRAWYAISGRAVPASGPGDPQGIQTLIDWLHEHPEVVL